MPCEYCGKGHYSEECPIILEEEQHQQYQRQQEKQQEEEQMENEIESMPIKRDLSDWKIKSTQIKAYIIHEDTNESYTIIESGFENMCIIIFTDAAYNCECKLLSIDGLKEKYGVVVDDWGMMRHYENIKKGICEDQFMRATPEYIP